VADSAPHYDPGDPTLTGILHNQGEIELLIHRVAVLENNMGVLKTGNLENEVQLRVIIEGYQTILHEVRETRASVETLYQKQAEAQLSAIERHAGLLKWLMRGVFVLTTGVVSLGAIHAILTGTTWSSSVIDIIKMMLGE